MPEPSEEGTSKQRIYRDLRRSIIMGHRKPGNRLSVSELAENYCTSITPVRDALQMLNQEGLVTIKPRSGYFVTRITLKQLRDLLELREILELASVERAANLITGKQLEQLKRIHEGYTGDDDVSYERYTDENRHFHYLIARATGNQALAEELRRLHDRLARFMVIRHAGRTMEFTHARIIEALHAHDVDAAREAMADELTDSHQRIIDYVINVEGDTWHLDAHTALND